MSRTYVREVEPHRDLLVTDAEPSGGWQTGEDVRALLEAAERRLDARGVERELSGRALSSERADGLVLAARLLGAREDTLRKSDGKGRAVLTVGAQRIIRYPGSRTEAQLARARDRMQALEDDREERERRDRKREAEQRAKRHDGGDVAEVRERAVAAMRLLYLHEPEVHYTQGARRWDGLRLDLNPGQGQFPRYADCSSSTTWALREALQAVYGQDVRDRVNGSRWLAGYTGTQVAHGRSVSFDHLEPGDLLFYGSGWPYSHVAMYAGGGKVYSHGSERGPFLLPMRYRGDLRVARRYVG